MKKYVLPLIAILSALMITTSCTKRTSNEAAEQIRLMFITNEYPQLDDKWIDSVVIVENVTARNETIGHIVYVYYTYGAKSTYKMYYVDNDGDAAPVKETFFDRYIIRADNGFPEIDDDAYDIDSNGNVVVDKMGLIFIAFFSIGLLIFIILKITNQ